MKLKELHQHWQDYAIEFRQKPKCSVILKRSYYKCELNKIIGSRGKIVLEFYQRYDNGHWSSGLPHIFRCDDNNNCYQYRFYSSNINRYRWIKMGWFVKISSK